MDSTLPTVCFGISGSISAYKSLDIIRLLRKENIQIRPFLSQSAHKFVTPWSVETLSESAIITNDLNNGQISHLDACKLASAFIICPASANIIAKICNGMADDCLTASFLSFIGPKVIFPAMHTEMYENPITQRNLHHCREMGITVIEPTYGELACGDVGIGRLPDVNLISDVIQFSCLKPVDLSGQQIVVTCGGTIEPIDPVRSITNLSSGRSGHTMANMAAYFGANVILIRASQHPTLDSIKTIDVRTCKDLQDALTPYSSTCDCLIMNAAVSDFTIQSNQTKLNRNSLTKLTINPTEDILKTFNANKKPSCKSIGFCLSDSDELVKVGQQKRIDKGCDIIVANGVQSFGADKRSAYIIDETGVQPLTNISLIELSKEIILR